MASITERERACACRVLFLGTAVTEAVFAALRESEHADSFCASRSSAETTLAPGSAQTCGEMRGSSERLVAARMRSPAGMASRASTSRRVPSERQETCKCELCAAFGVRSVHDSFSSGRHGRATGVWPPQHDPRRPTQTKRGWQVCATPQATTENGGCDHARAIRRFPHKPNDDSACAPKRETPLAHVRVSRCSVSFASGFGSAAGGPGQP